MSLYDKIAELESILKDGKGGLFGKKALVDCDRCLGLLEDIKRCIPDDVYDLNAIAEDKKRMIAMADTRLQKSREMSARIISEAEYRAQVLIDESSIIAQAENEAVDIRLRALSDIAEAEKNARENIDQLYEKINQFCTEFETTVQTMLLQIQNIKSPLGNNKKQ